MATLSIPYSFSPGQVAQSAQVNANFQAIATAFTQIDNTNIGTAGLYASQIIPTSDAQATFGGSYAYTFPGAVNANGGVNGTTGGFTGQVTANNVLANTFFADSSGYASTYSYAGCTVDGLVTFNAVPGTPTCPPGLYSQSGTGSTSTVIPVTSNPKAFFFNASVSISSAGGPGVLIGQVTINFNSAVAFATSGTYSACCTMENATVAVVQNKGPLAVTFYVYSLQAISAGSTFADIILIGH